MLATWFCILFFIYSLPWKQDTTLGISWLSLFVYFLIIYIPLLVCCIPFLFHCLFCYTLENQSCFCFCFVLLLEFQCLKKKIHDICKRIWD